MPKTYCKGYLLVVIHPCSHRLSSKWYFRRFFIVLYCGPILFQIVISWARAGLRRATALLPPLSSFRASFPGLTGRN